MSYIGASLNMIVVFAHINKSAVSIHKLLVLICSKQGKYERVALGPTLCSLTTYLFSLLHIT